LARFQTLEELLLLGNTEDIFSSQRHDVHLPAQGASVSHRMLLVHHAIMLAQTVVSQLS
jgi:hypothetical protein